MLNSGKPRKRLAKDTDPRVKPAGDTREWVSAESCEREPLWSPESVIANGAPAAWRLSESASSIKNLPCGVGVDGLPTITGKRRVTRPRL